MEISRRKLAWFYLVIGLAAWVLTSLHLPGYLSSGFVGGTKLFWEDALLHSNPAGKFLAVDIVILALVVLIWMVIEASRRQMRGIYIYILVAYFVGISLAVPVFLAHRERAIMQANPADTVVALSKGLVVTIGMMFVVNFAFAAMTFI